MNRSIRHAALRPTALALALATLYGSAFAQAAPAPDAKDKNIESEAVVGVGVAGVTGDKADRALWGQYNGMRDNSVYGLLGFDWTRRDLATGTLLQANGSNLGLDTRDLRFLWRNQGDWGLRANYTESHWRDPYTVNTGVVGAGGGTPSVVPLARPGAGFDFEPGIQRREFGLGGGKWVSDRIEITADVKTQHADGATRYGVGMACPSTVTVNCLGNTASSVGSAVLFLPKPVDYDHTQVETRVAWAGDALRLSGGYYGSFFSNNESTLRAGIPGTLNNPLGQPLPADPGLRAILGLPVALAPDNQAHAFDLTGAYYLTPTTVANFKLGYSLATQKQDFAGAGLANAPAGAGSLDGEVSTKLAQVTLSARPLPKLSVVAEARWRDFQDDTPIRPYNVIGNSTFTNRDLSNTNTGFRLQGTYRFPLDVAGTLGVRWASIDRATYTPTAASYGISALREKTDETTFLAEVRRSMSETVTGSLRYEHGKRDGSDWLRPNSTTGVTTVTDPAQLGTNAIFMPNLADRDRDALKLGVNWMASDKLALNFAADWSQDDYKTTSHYALRQVKTLLFSVDASYALSDAWNLTGFVTYGTQDLDQARPAGYILAYDNKNTNVGVGVNGKVSDALTVGGNFAWLRDDSGYAQSLGTDAAPGAAALLGATGGLPGIVFQTVELRLFGRYVISKASALRVDLAYQRAKYDDWAYGYNGVPFVYSDNTTVSQQSTQNVGYLGLTWTYAWR